MVSADQALGAAKTDLTSLVSKESAEMKPAVDKYKEIADSPTPTPPDQQKVTAPPKQSDFGMDMTNFTAAMAVLATATGAFSRQHSTTALNAFAAGMKGYKDGNKDAYETAHKEWKDATDAAIENNKILTDKYKEVLDDRKLTEQEQVERLKMIGTQYQDPMMAQVKSVDVAAKVLDIQESAKARAQQAQEMLQMRFDMKQKQEDEAAKAADLRYDAWSKTPEARGLAEGYAKGVPPAELVRGIGNKAGGDLKMIQKLAYELHPELDLAKATSDYAGQKRESLAVATRSAPAKIAVAEMDKLSQPMIDAVAKLDPTKFPDLNAVQNAYQRKTGGPEVVKAFLAVQEFKTAFTNLMVRNGVPTDNARARADELVNMNMSLDQVVAVSQQAKITAGAVLDALHDVKDGKQLTTQEEPKKTKALGGVTYTQDENGDWHTQ